jgi:hypothetical protein
MEKAPRARETSLIAQCELLNNEATLTRRILDFSRPRASPEPGNFRGSSDVAIFPTSCAGPRSATRTPSTDIELMTL